MCISGSCLHCTDLFHGCFLNNAALHMASKEPHCMALHGPAGQATVHELAQKTCKWIPNFTDLHSTACKVPIHMYPKPAPLMELNSARRYLH